ncbi:MAG: hypothetical protein C5S47_06525 [Candidatus Methanogasteraceae archaeon]|nr:MAG: hypothetical protein C5S47_06525 [ANME-2 cluster archaeon]
MPLPVFGTTENSSEIHTGTFVLCAIASLRLCVIVFQFNARAQGRRDAKGGANRSLHVFCVVVHPTDHYENHWISRQCPRIQVCHCQLHHLRDQPRYAERALPDPVSQAPRARRCLLTAGRRRAPPARPPGARSPDRRSRNRTPSSTQQSCNSPRSSGGMGRVGYAWRLVWRTMVVSKSAVCLKAEG